jgi:hypothetical protein
MNSEKKAAWDAVHAAYGGMPIVGGEKKKFIIKRKSPPSAAPIRAMPFAGGAQKEEIPEREEEGPKEIKARAEELPSRNIPDYIKNLKVGDEIVYGQSSGYMNDAGDSRDVGYTIHGKVLKLLGRYKYEVTPQFSSNKPEVFALNSDGDWLRDTNRNRLTIYAVNGHTRPKGRSEEAIKRKEALEAKKRKAASAKVSEDWTKATKSALVQMIDAHFAAQGKSLTGHRTADKPRLIEIIRKYKIRE